MTNKCEWKEEELFDFVAGKIDRFKSKQLRLHLKSCHDCQSTVSEWKAILHCEQNVTQPSPGLKRRIDKSIDKFAKHKVNKWVSKPAYAIAGCFLFIFALLGLLQMKSTGGEEYFVQQQEELSHHPIARDANTSQFKVIPTSNFNKNEIEGTVWLNDKNNEMLLKAEGLTPIVEKDYQLWMIHPKRDLNGELLTIKNGMIVFYYKGEGLDEVRFIEVSLEPKGGSPLPTGPKAFYVDLQQ
ncbi:anti-sigma factor [Pueribacillus theae]|nr:anti-sigma factor [Pueribacillus theae]